MTRRPTRPRARSEPTPPPLAGGHRARRRVLAGILGAAALVVIAVVLSGRGTQRRARAGVESMGSEEAFRMGADLAQRGRAAEAAPYLARAAADSATWLTRFAYASVLYDLAREPGRTEGAARIGPRRASEAVRILRECFEELDRAEAVAPSPAHRAILWDARANILATWGLPWDAFAASRRAYALDPRPEYARARDAVLRRLRLLDQPAAPHDAQATTPGG